MTEELSRDIDFELAELICIEHTLSPSQAVAGSQEAGVLGPGKETCLKIGTAIVEALSNQCPVTISFTEDELWLLRERVSIYTSQGANADLGLVIKAKLYHALLEISNKRVAAAAVNEAGVTTNADSPEDEIPSREEVDDAVRRWQEVSGFRRKPGAGGTSPHRTDDDSENEAGPKTPSKPR